MITFTKKKKKRSRDTGRKREEGKMGREEKEEERG